MCFGVGVWLYVDRKAKIVVIELNTCGGPVEVFDKDLIPVCAYTLI